MAIAGKKGKSTTAINLWFALNYEGESRISAEKTRSQLLSVPELFTHAQVRNIFDSLVGRSIEAQNVFSNATKSLVVVTPDQLSMTEELHIRHSFTNVRGIVLNKSTKLSEKFFNAPLIESLQEDQTVLHAAQLGQPLAQLLPERDPAKHIKKLAQKCLRL